jgi:ATP/maltotriose-dependent transcriptional regulator MalT
LSTDGHSLAQLLVVQGLLTAMIGDFDRARELAEDGLRLRLELGRSVAYAALTMPRASIELLAGDGAAAAELLSRAQEMLEPTGERGYLSTVQGMRALAFTLEQRFAEAEALADESRRVGSEDDITTQIYWRIAKARAAGAGGRHEEARRLAAEVIGLATRYDVFDTPVSIVHVAHLLEPDDARAALERAVAGADAKGNVVTAAQARAKLEALP